MRILASKHYVYTTAHVKLSSSSADC